MAPILFEKNRFALIIRNDFYDLDLFGGYASREQLDFFLTRTNWSRFLSR